MYHRKANLKIQNGTMNTLKQMDNFDPSNESITNLRSSTQLSTWDNLILVEEAIDQSTAGHICDHKNRLYQLRFMAEDDAYDSFDLASWLFIQLKKVHPWIERIMFDKWLLQTMLKVNPAYYRALAAKLSQLIKKSSDTEGYADFSITEVEDALRLFLQPNVLPHISFEDCAKLHDVPIRTVKSWCYSGQLRYTVVKMQQRILLIDALCFTSPIIDIAA